MPLLLTLLSVLATWTFLGVLLIGVLLIRKALESVRIYLEKIAMGVRAIETQTAPVRSRTEEVKKTLERTRDAFDAAASQFKQLERQLEVTPGPRR